MLAASRPRAVAGSVRRVAAGLGVAACVTAVIAGYPLGVQFFGPLREHGSPFTTDFFKNDLSSFVVPSSYQFFHTAGSAAAASRYQGRLPEYLGYLGWPLIIVLVLAAIAGWRRLPVRATAVACAVLGVFSLGGTLLFGGHGHPAIKLPWYWLQGLPLLSAGAAGPVLPGGGRRGRRAAGLRRGRGHRRLRRLRRAPAARLAAGWRPAAVVLSGAVLAVLPIVPKPLPVAAATPPPPGWSAAFAALRLPASASVLVVPIPMSTFTEPLRWQADTREPGSLVGGYFMGPAWNGRAYTDGSGTPAAGLYLNAMWTFSQAGLPKALTTGVLADPRPGSAGYVPVKAVTDTKMREQIRAWRVSAVVAVAKPDSRLGRYLTILLGPPAVVTGDVLAWRTRAQRRFIAWSRIHNEGRGRSAGTHSRLGQCGQ